MLKIKKLITFLFLLISSCNVFATDFNLNNFKQLPILHEGRLKPIIAFANWHEKALQNDKIFNKKEFNISQFLFRPDNAIKQRIFRIENPNLIAMLQIKARKDNLHSSYELAQAFEKQQNLLIKILNKEENNLTSTEQEFLDLFGKFNNIMKIAKSLTIFLPIPIGIEERFFQKNQPATYFDLLKHRGQIYDEAINLSLKNSSQLTEKQRNLMTLAFYLKNIEQTSQNNKILKILPPIGLMEQSWVSPWQVILEDLGTPMHGEIMKIWQKLINSYYSKKQSEFDSLVKQIWQKSNLTEIEQIRIKTEYYLYKIDLINLTIFCYTLAIFAAVINLLKNNILDNLPKSIILSAAAINLTLISLRIFVSMRPPISNLYESIIAIAAVPPLLVLVDLKNLRANSLNQILISLISCLILFCGKIYESADSMPVLIPVLDSNFWLTTHVIFISLAYGVGILSAMIAHLKLIKPELKLMRILVTMSILSLFLTTLGTALGGIWADQSWGRFWGWDPKENGALLIILWLIFTLHGKLSKDFSDRIFVALTAFLNVIIIISWFGVNLLETGLHSYGFTNRAGELIIFICVLECVFILYATCKYMKNKDNI